MRTKEWILNKIDKNVKDIVKLAKIRIKVGDVRFSGSSGLKSLQMWTVIETYCEVLEISPIKYWNQICEVCPNLGDITEE